MRRRLAMGAGMLILVAAWYVAVARLVPRPAPPGWPPPSDLDEYSAVLHVHSEYSHDGRGTVEEIAEAARQAGVQVVFLTDHNTLAPLLDGKEGWYGDTLVLVGAEITTGSGYLLLLRPDRDLPVRARGFDLDDLVSRYRAAGGIVLMAHVDHPRLGWRDEVPAVHGLELIDVFDQLVAAPLLRQLLGLLAYPANPRMAILSVVHWPRSVLDRWDRMTRQQALIGALGLDAHGGLKLTEEAGVRFPSHRTAFGLGRLHFATPYALAPGKRDRARVYQALRAGHFYNAFEGFAPAAGFRFLARSGGRVALMGESVRLADDLRLEVVVPPGGDTRVRVVRDGVVWREPSQGGRLTLPVEAAGVYRVEVDLRWSLWPIGATRYVPWILSNPIYVEP